MPAPAALEPCTTSMGSPVAASPAIPPGPSPLLITPSTGRSGVRRQASVPSLMRSASRKPSP